MQSSLGTKCVDVEVRLWLSNNNEKYFEFPEETTVVAVE